MIPVFIFVTGIFARKSRKKPKDRAIRMFKIYIIMQVIVILYYGFVLKIINPTKTLLEPRFTLWYLLTCGYLYLLEYIIKKYRPKQLIIFSIIIAIGIGFIRPITNLMSLTRTIGVIPFFIIGYYYKEIKALEIIKKYKIIATILGILIILWFSKNTNFFLFKDTYLKYNYYEYNSVIENCLKRCLLYVLFFIFSIFILNYIPKRKTILGKFGSNSLIIYLSHGILLKSIAKFDLFISNEIIGTIIIYLGVILISMLEGKIINKIKVMRGKSYERRDDKYPEVQIQAVYETT